MLEPVAFEKSLDSYLDSRSAEEIRGLVLRSIKHLDGAHRVQLALFLGLDVASDPIAEVGGSTIDDSELAAFIEKCGLLRERFGAFLRDNPRAIRALGKTATEQILGKSEMMPLAIFRRVPPKIAAAIALALFMTFVPLAAQYEHQRGMVAGPTETSVMPPIAAGVPPVRLPTAHLNAPQRHAQARIAFAPDSHPYHPAARREVVTHSAVVHKRAHVPVVAARRPAHHRRTFVASNWKFDKRFNPYFNRAAWHVRYVGLRHLRGHASTPVVRSSGFEGRASLVVSSYLNALIAGNTTSALHHLGLPSDANRANLSELPIVTRDTRTHVVAVDPQPDGRTKVEVDINGRSGEYFEVFYVARDGPAVRIMDRFYIPVNRTAEERAARLLARDGH